MGVVSSLTSFLLFGTYIVFASDLSIHSLVTHSISYDDLVDDSRFLSADVQKKFHEQLSTTGIISVSGGTRFRSLKTEALTSSSSCGKVSNAAKTTVFADGTERTTLATKNDQGGLHYFNHGSQSTRCNTFDEFSHAFRTAVSDLSFAFSQRLSSIFQAKKGGHFLNTLAPNKKYDSIKSIVENGDQLEHFHSYSRSKVDKNKKNTKTIDFHTDMGLFIAFTPPLGKSTGTFNIRDAQGRGKIVDFTGTEDHLVFMMGDAVNQYLNQGLEGNLKIHATQHAMTMGEKSNEERLWYGRMFLSPHDAISENHDGQSYGQLRDLAEENIRTNPKGDHIALGCSGDLVARELSGEGGCSDDTIFCWNRCMNYTAIGLYYDGYALSEEKCIEEGYDFLECIDVPTDTVYNASIKRHGGFRPACTNSTDQYVPSPSTPAQPDTCTDFEGFLTSKADSFPDGQKAFTDDFVLQWGFQTRETPSREEICFRLAFNGNPGWLSIGFYNSEAKQVRFEEVTGEIYLQPNYMLDTPVVMGIFYESDTTDQVVGVDEYRIHNNETSFSIWGTPLLEQSIMDETLENDECYAEVTFCTDNIDGQQFQLEGVNQIMWGYEATRTDVSKHKRGTRGIANMDFSYFGGESAANSLHLSSFYFAAYIVAVTMAFF